MRRRVIKHGPASYIISLPAEWVRRHSIHKGDEIAVTQRGNALLVSPDEVQSSFVLEEDVSGLAPRLVDRLVARSYQKGYDQIRLFYNDISILDTIQKKVHELIGYEIIEQDEHSCVIKSIASKLDIDFDNSLKRAFLIVKQMAETCLEGYKDSDAITLNNLHLKDLEVNRLCYFCLRQINKEQLPDRDQQRMHILYYLVEHLEDLGDCYKRLARELALAAKHEKISRLLQLQIEHYTVSYEFFYKPTKDGANRAFKLHNAVKDAIKQLFSEKLSVEQLLAIHSIRTAADITYHFTTMRLDTMPQE